MNDLTNFALMTLGLFAAMALLLYVLTKIDPQTQAPPQLQLARAEAPCALVVVTLPHSGDM